MSARDIAIAKLFSIIDEPNSLRDRYADVAAAVDALIEACRPLADVQADKAKNPLALEWLLRRDQAQLVGFCGTSRFVRISHEKSSVAETVDLLILEASGRTPLNRDMAEELARVLDYFARHGKLP